MGETLKYHTLCKPCSKIEDFDQWKALIKNNGSTKKNTTIHDILNICSDILIKQEQMKGWKQMELDQLLQTLNKFEFD
jgi:hypothetical protein